METMQHTRVGGPANPSPVEAIGAGARADARAWEALVQRYSRMVHSIARRCGLSAADAADVSQTVWLRLFEHADRLRQPERVGGWLATTTRNEAMRVARQRRAVPTAADRLEALSFVDAGADQVSGIEAEERHTQVRALLATLPVRQQALLDQLMADPQPSYVDIASTLGIPVGSIGPTRQRTLRALRSKCIAAHI